MWGEVASMLLQIVSFPGTESERCTTPRVGSMKSSPPMGSASGTSNLPMR